MSLNSTADQTVVITDASCLIILRKINFLTILHRLFAVVITTPEISEEYGLPLPGWITIVSVKNKSLQDDLLLVIDKGEASAIALAQEIENKHLITDDLAARKNLLKNWAICYRYVRRFTAFKTGRSYCFDQTIIRSD